MYLETGFAEAAKRVGLDRPRPLLLGNPRAQLRPLLEQRLPIYAELARITVSTDGRSPEEVADEIAAPAARPAGTRRPVTADQDRVGGEQPYEVVVGTGVLGELPALAGPGPARSW